MTNGQLPTWFVLKWLSTHEDHRAEVPDSIDYYPCTATVDRVMRVSFMTHFPELDGGDSCGAAPIRNDWTLYRADGKPVRFKQRAKPEHVGVLCDTDVLRVGRSTWTALDPDSTFDVYVRERR